MTTSNTWIYEEDFDEDESLGLHIKEGREIIASLPGISQHDFDNAKMLAAAPDLLAACIEALTLFDNHPECYEELGTLEVLKAAIEKAIQ